ncbi:MAG: GTP-dependent dephospho-CoA kinase family protein [Candidatus Asgardarchaeia archaeon]
MKKYVLPIELRAEFKKPHGLLIEGDSRDIWSKVSKILKTNEDRGVVITVGDVVSINCLKYSSIKPDFMIIDKKSMRVDYLDIFKIFPKLREEYKILKVSNPPGSITEEAINSIKEIFNSKRKTIILVKGEEDLFTLISVIFAPENSYIIYGQPNQGVVLIKADRNKREKFIKYLKKMEVVEV